ncbi:hypothetical protein B0J14DRAFT_658108 [Halenospora varia]|nr:hypothetical protein B0J14DRAFT_658108 [Halenospora varia]
MKRYFDKAAPVVADEEYIAFKEDLVTLKPGRQHSWLDSFVESIILRMSGRFIRYTFTSPDVE